MRLPKTLLLLVFVAAIALSVLYGGGQQVEGFMEAGTIFMIIGFVILGLFAIAAFVMAIMNSQPRY